MNNIVLVGRLTRDIEVKTLPSGTIVANYTLAVDNPFKKDDEGNPMADFINCVTFGKQAENLAKYKKKGNILGVQGRLQTRTWEDNDGNRRYATEVITNSTDYIVFDNNKNDEQLNNDNPDDQLPF